MINETLSYIEGIASITSPSTGDRSPITVIVILVLAILLFLFAFLSKRKKKQ